MQTKKYENLHEQLPCLQCVLEESIQAGFVDIKTVDHDCTKFLTVVDAHPKLKDAAFVVYSPYMRKQDHRYEQFVFLDKEGKSLGHISGAEMELYGLIAPCTNLKPFETSSEKENN